MTFLFNYNLSISCNTGQHKECSSLMYSNVLTAPCSCSCHKLFTLVPKNSNIIGIGIPTCELTKEECLAIWDVVKHQYIDYSLTLAHQTINKIRDFAFSND